jgi:hypothetical protein
MKKELLVVAADRLIVPTMSKTDDLLLCQWPYGKYAPRGESTLPARFGTAVHEGMAARLRGDRVEIEAIAATNGVDADKVMARINSAFPELQRWLDGKNPWKINFGRWQQYVEKSYALDMKTTKARTIENPTADEHLYLDAKPYELPGTADFVAVKRGSLALILDHKTGYDVPEPSRSGQLKTLALAVCRLYGAKEAIVGFVHAPDTGMTTIYADKLDAVDLASHWIDLKAAWGRIDDGSLTPSKACNYCPAFAICPAQKNALVALKRGGGALTAEKVGAIHQALGVYERLAETMRAQMKGYVKIHGEVERPDGKVLALIPRTKRNLSEASIRRALGPLKGAREIARLEKLGCVDISEYEELRAGKE